MTLEEAQKVADIVNTAGNRITPIIQPFECDGCSVIFFGLNQDKGMRDTYGVSHKCAKCRREEQNLKRRKK